MTIIEADSVYIANPNQIEEDTRGPIIVGNYDPYATYLTRVTGLQPYDFAVFGHLISKDYGVSQDDWLVIDYQFGEATLIPSTPIQDDPASHMTPHLEKLIRRAGKHEVAQFSIDSLLRYIFDTK